MSSNSKSEKKLSPETAELVAKIRKALNRYFVRDPLVENDVVPNTEFDETYYSTNVVDDIVGILREYVS